jgi:hypothetical protein
MVTHDERPRRVVAIAALTAVIASVVIPGVAGSQTSGRGQQLADEAFVPVMIDPLFGTSTTTFNLDPDANSAAPLEPDGSIGDPLPIASPVPRAVVAAPAVAPIVAGPWHFANELSWYGPNFYGQHTACGQILTKTLLGVANRTLPCGTLITFKNPVNGRTITVPVVDRGPYVAGRDWDLTYATCTYLGHCYTGSMYWRRAEL